MDVAPRRRKVKKVSGGHGHHGGAWKVAYADFVTAMMALFMVMWLLASSDAKTRAEISNYFRSGILPEGDMAMGHAAQINPSVIEQSGTPPPPPGESSLEAEANQLRNEIAKLASGDGELSELAKYVTVKVTPDGVVIEAIDREGAKDMMFDSASSELKPALVKFLSGLAPKLARRKGTIEINGHTDARRFALGSGKTNWDLSYERAAAARGILEGGGVPPGKIVGVVARGAAQLFDPSRPLAAANRRLSILIRATGPDGPPGGEGAVVTPPADAPADE